MSSKTPVTILQEFMVRKHEVATYNLICNQVGTQDPLFKYEVTGLGKLAIGSGKSKKEAKHEAARLLLHILKDDTEDLELKQNPILKEVEACFSPFDDTIKDNAVGALQTFCCDYQLMNPKYDLIFDIGPPHSKLFSIRCTVSSLTYESTARTKKQAKHRCSAGLLQKLKLCLSEYLEPTDKDQNSCFQNNDICNLAVRTSYLGHPISDFHNIFTSAYFPESSTLLNLKDVYKNIRDVPNPLESLRTVCEELNFELDITELPSVKNDVIIVNLFLISKPGWSFIGFGGNYEEALVSTAYEAFEFLVEMTAKL